MLLVVTSAFDPALPLLQAEPRVTVLVPGHLSQAKIAYEVLRGGDARLVASRGPLRMTDVHGALTCIARVRERDLSHVHPDDRAYVADEMTAFLASLLSDLPCPVFNRPTGAHLGGVSWTQQQVWRTAKEEGVAVCTDAACDAPLRVVALDFEPLRATELPAFAAEAVRRISRRVGVRLLSVELCCRHAGVRSLSPQAAIDSSILDAVLIACGARA